MYFNPNAKWYSFTYKNTPYSSGTKLIYNGKCYLNEHEVVLNNRIVTYLYDQNNKTYFQDNDKIYTCLPWEFTKRIVNIIVGEKQEAEFCWTNNMIVGEKQTLAKQETEFYWTNDMVVKTLWYIVIMLVAIIFKDCIGIWILATIIWYNSTFKKEK